MRTFTTFLAALGIAATVAAQKVDPRTVPPCIRQCSVANAQRVGCRSPLDTQCTCIDKKSQWTNTDIISCLSACGGSALSDAIGINDRLCKDGVDCPTGDPGWALCGDLCIDLSIQSCQSGAVHNNIRRRSLTVCEPHERMCQVGHLFGSHHDQAGYECLDVSSNLEACGGCPGEGGVDCTALYGAVDVTCRKGHCHIEECEEGLTLINGRCK